MSTKSKVAVIGAGLIGRAWAIVFARAGHPVALYDVDAAALAASRKALSGNVADLASQGLIGDAAAVEALVTPVPDLGAALAGAAHVQENSPEKLEVKLALFAELDRRAAPDTVLASSSSALAASLFTEDLAGRARCLVAHPANPPYLLPIVELSPAPWTAPETVAATHRLMSEAGMVPVTLKRELAGFLLNRLQAALLDEAFRLVDEGYATTEDIDKTVKDGLGLRWSFMGPFETIDLNAPGGIADYVERYGPALQALLAGGERKKWDVAGIAAERRAALPAAGLATRQIWRDRRLMALLRHKQQAAKEIGE